MADLATLKIVVDSSGAIRAVDGFGNHAEAAAKKTDKLAAAAKVAGVALAGAFVYALHKTVEETKAAQAAQAQLEAAVRSTGGAAGQSVAKLNAHAAALQKVTTYGDDAVVAMQSVLLTFTKVSGDTFPRATEAVLDLSARLGMDLKSAALQVGKALNDPILGVTALARAGIQFTESQKDTIKALVETNRLAEAQAVILKELQVQFGGSAAAARNTLGGALTGLSNTWGDLFEVSRESSQGIINAIEGINRALPKLRDGFSDLVLEWDLMATEIERRNVALLRAFTQLRLYTTVNPTTRRELRDVIADYDAQIERLRGLRTEQELTLAASVGERLEREARARREVADATRQQVQAVVALAEASGARLSLGHMTGTTHGFGGLPPVTRAPAGTRLDSLDPYAHARAAEEIARNFRENMQRATGDIFATFLREGTLSVRSIARLLADAGAQSLGQKGAAWLSGKMGGMPPGFDIAALAVGGFVTAFIDNGAKFRAEMRAATDAFKTLRLSLTDWIEDATLAGLSEQERQRVMLGRRADQFAADAWRIYRNAPGDYESGLTGNTTADRDLIQRRLDAVGGDWNRLWQFGETPVRLLREYFEALQQIADGTVEHTEAIEMQAKALLRAEAAERARALSVTAGSLSSFGRDLRLSNLSIYNPFQQKQDAEAEYNRLVALARSGDQEAAGQLPAAARAFLEASRGINASGTRYAADFQRVERETAELAAYYDEQAELNRLIADGIHDVETEISRGNDILTRTDSYVQAQLTVMQESEARRDAQTVILIEAVNTTNRRLVQLEERLAA